MHVRLHAFSSNYQRSQCSPESLQRAGTGSRLYPLRNRGSATRGMHTVQQRGLTLELDDPPGPRDVAPEDHSKDGTGIGQIWQAATDLLCDWLELHSQWLQEQGRCLELGAGVGVAGMLVAKLGSEVTLTDGHPGVVSRLRANVALNGLDRLASVALLDWDVPVNDGQRYRLVLGADLAFAQRSAAQCAARVRELCDGVFLYAHQERHAIFMGTDGQVQREATDSGLDSLLEAISPLESRRLCERDLPDGERVVLLALGAQAALAALPDPSTT